MPDELYVMILYELYVYDFNFATMLIESRIFRGNTRYSYTSNASSQFFSTA